MDANGSAGDARQQINELTDFESHADALNVHTDVHNVVNRLNIPANAPEVVNSECP